MSWAQVTVEVIQHKKSMALGKLLYPKGGDVARYAGQGLITAVWAWCATHQPDGDLSEIDPQDLADGVRWHKKPEELLSVLVASQWMDADYRLHNWMHYTGASIIKRKEKVDQCRRMTEAREAKRKSDDNVTLNDTLHDTLERDVERLREPPLLLPKDVGVLYEKRSHDSLTLAAVDVCESVKTDHVNEHSLASKNKTYTNGKTAHVNGSMHEVSDQLFWEIWEEVKPNIPPMVEALFKAERTEDFSAEVQKLVGYSLKKRKVLREEFAIAQRRLDPNHEFAGEAAMPTVNRVIAERDRALVAA